MRPAPRSFSKGTTTTTAPRPSRTSLQLDHSPLFYMLSLLCIVPVATTICSLVLMAVKAYSHHPRYKSRSEAPCCVEYVALLSRIVNKTVDPCVSVYDFICDRYSVQAAPGSLIDTPALDSSWGYKPYHSQAGKLAYQYYRSCVMSSVQEQLGAQTSSALLEFLRPNLTFPARLVVEISLKYAMTFPVLFMSENMFEIWPHELPLTLYFNVYNLAVTLDTDPAPVMSTEAKQIYLRIRRDALGRVNEALSSNVSEREVDEVYKALRSEPERNYVNSNLTGLHKLAAIFTEDQWRTLLENVTRSKITGKIFLSSNASFLKRSLEILLNAASGPKSVVFSLVEATSRLLRGAVLEKDNKDVRQRYFSYCHKISHVMVAPLLLVHLMATLNAGEIHDTMLQAYFRSIANAVSARAAALVAREDAESVRRYVQRKRFLLPSEVFSLDLPLPTLTNNYAQNYLGMHESQWTLYNFAMPEDVPRLITMKATLGWQPWDYEGVVILPVSAYSVVNITSKLDAVVPLATLGILIADCLWKGILDSTMKWSNATTQILERRRTCLTQADIFKSRVRFYYPELSLDAALDAARRKHWNAKLKFSAYQLQKSLRSQLFFLLILFNYYCPASKYASPSQHRFQANKLFHRSDDFREAFGCGVKQDHDDFRRC